MASVWDSFFQITGAATFCLPSPWQAYGYLANTIFEVVVGNSDGATLSGFQTVLSDICECLKEIKDDNTRKECFVIKGKIEEYTASLVAHWNEISEEDRADEGYKPPLSFFFNDQNENCLYKKLTSHEDDLINAVSMASSLWANRSDPKGNLQVLAYLIYAMHVKVSLNRQLASTCAMIANLSGNSNYKDLHRKIQAFTQLPGALRNAALIPSNTRPDPYTLIHLESPEQASQYTSWAQQHWGYVNSHRRLVLDHYEFTGSSHLLQNVRIRSQGGQFGLYNRAWFELVDIWRRAEESLSKPAEIYLWTSAHGGQAGTQTYYQTQSFAHGWPTVNPLKNGVAADDCGDLKPTQEQCQMLDDWYQNMRSMQAALNLDSKNELTIDDQLGIIDCFQGCFAIGLVQPRYALYLLRRLRQELMSWRLYIKQDKCASVDRLHAAAWPTSGELSSIVRILNNTTPCSWSAGKNHILEVIQQLRPRWSQMVVSGANPKGIDWMAGRKYWWLDRSNADSQPMPLLPETIVLILEVWLATSIRAHELQKPITDHATYGGPELIKYLEDNKVVALDLGSELAYQLPSSIKRAGPIPGQWSMNDKDTYDSNRERIREAWEQKRVDRLDELLGVFGLNPSSEQLSSLENTAQSWANGLIDLRDDLPLQKPTDKITNIKVLTASLPPMSATAGWCKGSTVKYSYAYRSLSEFKAVANDQHSEESELSDAFILDEHSVMSGLEIQIPRDRLLLANQFLVYRTLSKPESSGPVCTWIGSGHFLPGQLTDAVFHDGGMLPPPQFPEASINVDERTKAPRLSLSLKDLWNCENQVVYVARRLDALGTGKPSSLSPSSIPVSINPACGMRLRIPLDAWGEVATAVEILRQILIVSEKGVTPTPLTTIAKLSRPPGDVDFVELVDGDQLPEPGAVSFSLKMTTKGLELLRSGQSTPIWTVYPSGLLDADKADGGLQSCRQQGDGNLVLYDKTKKPFWSSDTMEAPGKTNSARALRLRSNGELAIVDSVRLGNTVRCLSQAILKVDGPLVDVFLRNGEMLIPGQEMNTQTYQLIAADRGIAAKTH